MSFDTIDYFYPFSYLKRTRTAWFDSNYTSTNEDQYLDCLVTNQLGKIDPLAKSINRLFKSMISTQVGHSVSLSHVRSLHTLNQILIHLHVALVANQTLWVFGRVWLDSSNHTSVPRLNPRPLGKYFAGYLNLLSAARQVGCPATKVNNQAFNFLFVIITFLFHINVELTP